MKRMHSHLGIFFLRFLEKCHNAVERRESEMARSIMGRRTQRLPPSFMQREDIKTNMPRLSAYSSLNLV